MPQPLVRFLRALVLVAILTVGCGLGGQRVTALETPPIEIATARLQQIANDMKFIRFCSRATCQFKDIEVKVTPDEAASGQLLGRIDAIMDRPSTMLDLAHYNFAFSGDRWELLGGEELSDVSSFSFNGDSYTVYSAYSGRTRTAKLDSADSNLRVGYRDLYYLTMDRGMERVGH